MLRGVHCLSPPSAVSRSTTPSSADLSKTVTTFQNICQRAVPAPRSDGAQPAPAQASARESNAAAPADAERPHGGEAPPTPDDNGGPAGPSEATTEPVATGMAAAERGAAAPTTECGPRRAPAGDEAKAAAWPGRGTRTGTEEDCAESLHRLPAGCGGSWMGAHLCKRTITDGAPERAAAAAGRYTAVHAHHY